MQAQLLGMVTPAIAVIFSEVFALLWWRDQSSPMLAPSCSAIWL